MNNKVFFFVPIFAVIALAIGCSVYESDAHKFIDDNANFENGKITISANKFYETASCSYLTQGYYTTEKNDLFILKADIEDGEITIHQNPSSFMVTTKLQHSSQNNLNFSCVFLMKSPDLDQEALLSLLNATTKAFEN